MRQVPGGTVTILFTDLVKSTELLESLGDDEYESVRRPHIDLLRRAVVRHRGQVVKTEGDGMMASFAGAVDALACAVAIQQAVHHENQPRDAARRVAVRAGLHVGEPIVEGKDYHGMPVVVARRLCDGAQGGQIIASELLRELVGSRGGQAFRD
ncbi:MAG: adenylate/guanylate cyclase domain-containing protein, partial [Dehalococcoidia bacterium]|nr:adenylate/guanylate cyclase domain-containing protein [Dehalococcoidia bacterium]